MMKKILLFLSQTVLIALFFTGCGDDSAQEEVKKKQQQDEADKKALKGKFKPSKRKGY